MKEEIFFLSSKKHAEETLLLRKGYHRTGRNEEQRWFQYVISVCFFVACWFWWRYRILSMQQLLVHSIVVFLLHAIWFLLLLRIRHERNRGKVYSVETIAYIVQLVPNVLAMSYWQVVAFLLNATSVRDSFGCLLCVCGIAILECKLALAIIV